MPASGSGSRSEADGRTCTGETTAFGGHPAGKRRPEGGIGVFGSCRNEAKRAELGVNCWGCKLGRPWARPTAERVQGVQLGQVIRGASAEIGWAESCQALLLPLRHQARRALTPFRDFDIPRAPSLSSDAVKNCAQAGKADETLRPTGFAYLRFPTTLATESDQAFPARPRMTD
jgi:hypothetical protein